MGYYSIIRGRIKIRPPIRLRELAGNEFLNPSTSVVQFEVEETREDHKDGSLLREMVVAVVPSTEESVKAYSLDDDLAEIAQIITAHGSACTGCIVREGEEQGDVERFFLNADGTVSSERARLTWPDGTAVA